MTTMTAPDTAALTASADVLAARTLTLSVRTRTFGNTRQASLTTARFTADGDEASAEPDKALLSLSKTLIDSPELVAIRRYDSKTDTLLRRYGRSTMLRPGIVVVSITQVQEIERVLAERKAGREPLVEAAVAAYPTRVAETVAKLGMLGNPLEYPSVEVFRSKFGFEWQWVQWSTPSALRTISPTIYESERAKFATEMALVADEARRNVRGLFYTLVSHLADRLKPGADGAPKVLQARTVEKLQSFLTAFTADYDVTNDTDLQPLIASTRSLLAGVPPAVLKDNEEFRAHVAARIDGILTALTPLVGTHARAISFTPEELAEAS